MALVVKNPPVNAGDPADHRFNSWVRKIPWRTAWQPTPVFLPGKSHGQRLVGYGPQCSTELCTTEATEHACTLTRASFSMDDLSLETAPASIHLHLHQPSPGTFLRRTIYRPQSDPTSVASLVQQKALCPKPLFKFCPKYLTFCLKKIKKTCFS